MDVSRIGNRLRDFKRGQKRSTEEAIGLTITRAHDQLTNLVVIPPLLRHLSFPLQQILPN